MFDQIVCDPGLCGGKPRIKGTRVTVRDIVSMIADGESPETLLVSYPFLTREDIRAAVAYAARSTEDSVLPLAAG